MQKSIQYQVNAIPSMQTHQYHTIRRTHMHTIQTIKSKNTYVLCDKNEMSVERQAPTPPVQTLCELDSVARNADMIFTSVSCVLLAVLFCF